MRFLSAVHTDVGIAKKNNQDAFGLKIAHTSKANIAFAILCDGMGGLKNGELASAFVVNAFSDWFENEFPAMILGGEADFLKVKRRWKDITIEQGRKIMQYGETYNISLGTTLTAILIVEHRFIYVQVGDSRIYKLNQKISQLTKDQTVVAMEVEQGKLTPEQAETDSRKNILLQCVGASRVIVPDIQMGTLQEGDMFLLCSDGFRHEITQEEMFGVIAPRLLNNEKVMKQSLIDLVELNKSRQEKDNITAMLIKAIH